MFQAQADEMWKVREWLSSCLNKKEMQMLLEANNQKIPTKGGESKASPFSLVVTYCHH